MNKKVLTLILLAPSTALGQPAGYSSGHFNYEFSFLDDYKLPATRIRFPDSDVNYVCVKNFDAAAQRMRLYLDRLGVSDDKYGPGGLILDYRHNTLAQESRMEWSDGEIYLDFFGAPNVRNSEGKQICAISFSLEYSASIWDSVASEDHKIILAEQSAIAINEMPVDDLLMKFIDEFGENLLNYRGID